MLQEEPVPSTEETHSWRKVRMLGLLVVAGATIAIVSTSWTGKLQEGDVATAKTRNLDKAVEEQDGELSTRQIQTPSINTLLGDVEYAAVVEIPPILSETSSPSISPSSSSPADTTPKPTPIPTINPTFQATPSPTTDPTLKPTTKDPTRPPSPSLSHPTRQDPSLQLMPPTFVPTDCRMNRTNIEEHYFVFFEEFDTSIAHDSLLESAFYQAYSSHKDLAACEPKLLKVTRIPDIVGNVDQAQFKQEEYVPLMIVTERVEFKTYSRQVSASGLFPTPETRAVFVGALNEFFGMRQIPIYALGVKGAPPPTPAPTLAPAQLPIKTPYPPLVLPTTPRPTAFPTELLHAMEAPTDFPTSGPTETLAQQPTIAPTMLPTDEPTTSPSFEPTVLPSISPTRTFPLPVYTMTTDSAPLYTPRPSLEFSTPSPTARTMETETPRTAQPSSSSMPTATQSASPTASRTSGPSTPTPSATPTVQPSGVPISFLPTVPHDGVPTFAPSDFPTPSPSMMATDAPDPSPAPTAIPSEDATLRTTRVPSANPTAVPTVRPNRDPSPSPSNTPTDDLTFPPSSVPSKSPTSELSVSTMPSSSPSLAPTTTPSTRPSVSPSLPPEFTLREPDLKSVQMILYGVPMLTSRSQSVWKTATENAIRDEVISILNNQVESVAVKVHIVTQTPEQLGASASTAVSRTRGPPDRLLQLVANVSSNTTVISSDLSVVFDVDFFIRAVIEDHNVRRYVGAALDTPGDQNIFMLRLKASGEAAFEDLTAVRLVLPPADSAVSGMLVGVGPDTLATGMTVGIAFVSVAGTALIVVGVYMWTKRRPDQSQGSPERMIENMSDYEKDVAFEVMENADVEVSTLGDPIPQGLAVAPMDPASTAEETTSLPYDYKVAADALPSLDDSGSYSFSEISSNILGLQTDDDTLDAQYFLEDRIEVEVPPGFLGLVLQEDSEGLATVYDMKELSPVADRVQIGDKLIAVDDIDITAMPVRSVMQLIASKQCHPIRKFVFTRLSKKLVRP